MRKDELMDEELVGMVSYTDETVPAEMPVMEQKPRSQKKERAATVPVAEYEPVPKTQRDLVDRLFDCVVWLGVCGGISMLMWWFWMNGMMDMEAAFPCILLSGCIGCFGGGMSFKK